MQHLGPSCSKMFGYVRAPFHIYQLFTQGSQPTREEENTMNEFIENVRTSQAMEAGAGEHGQEL
eukprot:8950174-Pyramimonas_sp.AAC.1